MTELKKDTLLGPSCWVCTVRFKSSVPPGPAHREDHHIFPRNAGGTDGPEVSLCERCHTTIHKIAKRVQGNADFKALVVGEPNPKKLLWLAHKIVEAEKLFDDDPNKQFRNGVALNEGELEMLKRLQTTLKRSRSDVLKLGLALLFKKTFG